MPEEPITRLHITAELGARLKQTMPSGPVLLGAKPHPLASLTDLAIHRMAVRAAEGDSRLQRDGQHWVDGRWTSCCETGETDCPCTCHDAEEPRP